MCILSVILIFVSHKNIISYCNRPYKTVEEMNKDLIEKWNSVVKKDDLVYHLGDFCLGNKEKIKTFVNQLNGKINLVMGNHDNYNIRFYYEAGFNRVYDKPIVIQDFFILSHKPFVPWEPDGRYANIHGHTHDDDRFKTTARTFNACVEMNEYFPVEFEEAVNRMKGLEKGER